MSNSICLVSFDTDRVKEYIFATPDLKKIRGGSTLLEILNQKDTAEVIRDTCGVAGYDIPGEHIAKGGGTAMAIVPTVDLAKQVIAAVERRYRRMTVNGTITGAYLEIPEADLHSEAFGQRVAELGARLRQAKDSKGYELALPLAAYFRECNACGRYPAFRLDPDEPGQALCKSCWKKHDCNRIGRNLFRSRFKQFVGGREGAGQIWAGFSFPEDLHDIGRVSRPLGYVGFIFADGNRMGSMLRKMRDFPSYHCFATGLDELVRQVTCGALLDVFLEPRQGVAPFEILLMGGDDLMLVMAADAALEVALKITEDFEDQANQLATEIGLSEHLSLSAGVVIAHERFPIKAMHDLAGDLLKRAKRASSQADNVGTIDFMVVTESATAGLDVIRDQVLTHHSFVVAPRRGEEFALTERPYTVEQLQKLLDFTREFKQKGFPNKSLQTMYEALFQSKIQAQLITLTVLTQAKREHQEIIWRFFDAFGDRETPYALLPWRERQAGQLSTPLGDLVEIYPFVRRS